MLSRSFCHSRSASSATSTASAASRRVGSAGKASAVSAAAIAVKVTAFGTPGEQQAEDAAIRHGLQHAGRAARDEQLHDFHAHALARQLREIVSRHDAGVQPVFVERPLAVSGVEAKEAQDTQVVFGDALLWRRR